MLNTNKILGNIMGNKPIKDFKSRNKSQFSVKQTQGKYFIFDNNIGEFLLGYSFRTQQDAEDFIKRIHSKRDYDIDDSLTDTSYVDW